MWCGDGAWFWQAERLVLVLGEGGLPEPPRPTHSLPDL
jgi:hypothetical protein